MISEPGDGYIETSERSGRIRLRIRVVNVFLWINFGPLPSLEQIAARLASKRQSVSLQKGRLIIKTNTPKACITLFPSGTGRCTGADSVENAQKAVLLLAEHLSTFAGTDLDPEWSVRNVVCVADLERKIRVARLADGWAAVQYEPEQFPGAVIRYEGGGVMLLFGSGKLVVTGVTSQERAAELIADLDEMLAFVDGSVRG